ncbi:MAG TPA: DoxX family protein [Candidatus Limnocylindria bacterium]|jgi:hypothetical protein|nr:DoxX family protein [Candidatus Limnocylindria bacterium]
MTTCKLHSGVSWTFQIIAAAILLQTLFFKFTGAEESKYIFSTLGVEPWGRIGTGLLELVTAGLLLRGRTAVFGALLAAGLMGGALFSHLTKLGIVVKDDDGLLFGLANAVLGSSMIVLWLRRFEVPFLRKWLSSNPSEACHWTPQTDEKP